MANRNGARPARTASSRLTVNFLGEPECENRKTDIEHMRIAPMHGGRGELRHHFPVMQDRAGDEVGKVGYEKCEIGRRQALDFTATYVHQQRDLGESEERNAQGQHQSQRSEPGIGNLLAVKMKKSAYLK